MPGREVKCSIRRRVRDFLSLVASVRERVTACPPSPSATIMLGIFMVAALGLAGPPLIVKLRAVCSELDIASTGLSVAEATTLATQAIGMEAEGSTLSEQVDFLRHSLASRLKTATVSQHLPQAATASFALAGDGCL